MYDMRVGSPTYTPLLCPSLRPFPNLLSSFYCSLGLITTYHTFVLHIMSSHFRYLFFLIELRFNKKFKVQRNIIRKAGRES